MRYPLLMGFLIFIGQATLPDALALPVLERDLKVLRQTLESRKINSDSPKYTSGFHCYDFSIEQCSRLGESRCRVVELGGHLFGSTGHAINIVRQPIQRGGKTQELFCLYDAQYRSSDSIPADRCWREETRNQIAIDYWQIPEHAIESYCRERKDVCNGNKATYWASWRSADLIRKGAYYSWWDNQGESDGQLLRTCERLNSETNATIRSSSRVFKFPSGMPACSSVITKTCRPRMGGAVACKNPSKGGGDRCLVLVCAPDRQYRFASWSNLPIPQCAPRALEQYCNQWRRRTNLGAIAKIKDDYRFEYSMHFCSNPRPRKGDTKIKQFRCDSDDNFAYVGNGDEILDLPKPAAPFSPNGAGVAE